MRLLQIIADGRPGGGTTNVLRLLAALRLRFECGLVTQGDSHLAGRASELGIPVYQLDFFRGRVNPNASIRLRKIVRRFNPDVINAHGGRAGFFLMALSPGVPVVYTIRGLHCGYKREPMRTFGAYAERMVMSRASQVVFVAERDRALAEAMRLLPSSDRVSVVHNGVDPLTIPRASSPLWDVGFVGRLSPEKDPLLFLRSLCLLPKREAIMVGGGSLERRLRTAVREWGLGGRVELKGTLSRPETLSVLARVKVLVVTSQWEGLPMVALEAMAAGVPVVAAAVGGLPEVLGDECGGLLVPRTPEDIAGAVKRILGDPALAFRLVERGRQRLMDEFTEEAMLRKLLLVYESALNLAGRGPSTPGLREPGGLYNPPAFHSSELVDRAESPARQESRSSTLVVEEAGPPVLKTASGEQKLVLERDGSELAPRPKGRSLGGSIGLNISAAYGDFAGVGSYAFQLARCLPAIAPDVEWRFFGPDTHLAPELSQENSKVFVAGKSGAARIFWEQSMLPLEALKERIDLLHCADFSQPVAYRRPAVNTIHDLSPFADPQFFPPAKRAYKQALIPFAARRSLAIITVSEFSRGEILNRFPFLEGRVFAIHHGVEPVTQQERHEVSPPFLLFVGTLENRKNIVPLIQAFRILKDRCRIPHRLVLVGKLGFGWKAIRAAIRDSGVSDAIEMRGYIPQGEFVKLYQSASALVYPSVYEGFGLPLLEAMAHGTPVVCSNAASLPEVGGDAVVYFDPHNVEEMACAIERVLDSPSLQAELREKGLKRAAMFTWKECARKHVEVYRKVLGR